MKETMTTFEMSEVAGCNKRTVQALANKIYPELAPGKGRTQNYTKAQSFKIMERLPKKNIIEKVETCLPESNFIPSPSEPSTNDVVNILDRMQQRQEEFMLRVLEMISPKQVSQKFVPSQKMLELPKPPPIKTRAAVSRVVRTYAVDNSKAFVDVWNSLYSEFKYRCSIDLKTRAKNQNKGPLDIAEDLDKMPMVLAIANEIFNKGEK